MVPTEMRIGPEPCCRRPAGDSDGGCHALGAWRGDSVLLLGSFGAGITSSLELHRRRLPAKRCSALLSSVHQNDVRSRSANERASRARPKQSQSISMISNFPRTPGKITAKRQLWIQS